MCATMPSLPCSELWVPNTSFGGGLQTLGFMERVTERVENTQAILLYWWLLFMSTIFNIIQNGFGRC